MPSTHVADVILKVSRATFDKIATREYIVRNGDRYDAVKTIAFASWGKGRQYFVR